MGWWGTGVMEGDEPMDVECTIRDILLEGVEVKECDSDDDSDAEEARLDGIVVEKLKAGDYQNVITAIESGVGDFSYLDANIAMQVLGEMIMCYGGKMPTRLKGKFRKAAKNDEWAQDDDDRAGDMKAFIARVDSYAGVAIEPTSRGLFAVIAEHIDSGKPGLVNK